MMETQDEAIAMEHLQQFLPSEGAADVARGMVSLVAYCGRNGHEVVCVTKDADGTEVSVTWKGGWWKI